MTLGLLGKPAEDALVVERRGETREGALTSSFTKRITTEDSKSLIPLQSSGRRWGTCFRGVPPEGRKLSVSPPTLPCHWLRGAPGERNPLAGPAHSSQALRLSPGCLLSVIVRLYQDRECQGLFGALTVAAVQDPATFHVSRTSKGEGSWERC